jgi:hypothetical protein
MPMPADPLHGAGLRAFLARLFHKGDFRSDFQTIKSLVQDTLPVEVNHSAVGRLDETVIVLGNELPHPAVRRPLDDLRIAAPPTHEIFQLSPGGVESVAQGHPDVPVFGVLALAVTETIPTSRTSDASRGGVSQAELIPGQ